jgi:hypothetical protein
VTLPPPLTMAVPLLRMSKRPPSLDVEVKSADDLKALLTVAEPIRYLWLKSHPRGLGKLLGEVLASPRGPCASSLSVSGAAGVGAHRRV